MPEPPRHLRTVQIPRRHLLGARQQGRHPWPPLRHGSRIKPGMTSLFMLRFQLPPPLVPVKTGTQNTEARSFPNLPSASARERSEHFSWWPRPESNRHSGTPRQILSLLCLPIPPRGHPPESYPPPASRASRSAPRPQAAHPRLALPRPAGPHGIPELSLARPHGPRQT